MNDWLMLRKDKQSPDVEFRLNRSETSYHGANHESRFLDEQIYDLFSSCFAESVEHDNKFNYYGPTKFRRSELINLRIRLGQVESEMNSIDSFDSLVSYFEHDEIDRRKHVLNSLRKQFDMEEKWSEVLLIIIETNRNLIGLVSQCIRENRILWVLGL
mgnify:CR=1 FL=1